MSLLLSLWGALAAPVVLWSDSAVDIAWAKAGFGIFQPIPLPPPGVAIGHLPKPAYLLFLRLAMRVFPGLGEARSIVVVQSVLLSLSILVTVLWVGRGRGARAGLALAVACLLFLRTRDSASAVMPEALATALLLPIGALLVDASRRVWTSTLVGLAGGVLFLVRPNCGAAMLLLAAVTLAAIRERRRLLLFFVGFGALALPFWHRGRSDLPGDPLHGLGYQIVEASADYYWTPSITPWPVGATPGQAAREELRVARDRWRRTLASPDPDRSRELTWRALHGLLGVEYSDLRWSPSYAAAASASRLLSPFVILGAVVILLVAPWRRDGPDKLAGLLLLALILGQNLLLGSNPRFVLPFLPVLLLFAVRTAEQLRGGGARGGILFAVVLCGLLLFARWQRHTLDWQWGKVERAGVVLRQTIPRGCLPSRAPATLHLRVAPADPASGAQWTLQASGRTIASSENIDRRKPAISAELPSWLLEENRRGRVELSLIATGSYGETSYLLFPVIPPPWAYRATREGSEEISPATGVRWGGLDWWAHAGSP